jgi:hypothetical protein
MPLLDQLPGVPKWVVGDRGYTSHRFREHIWSLGARPAIPPQRHEAPVACPDWIYANRNRVERLWGRLKKVVLDLLGTTGSPDAFDPPNACTTPAVRAEVAPPLG